jgi:hypothetical protein
MAALSISPPRSRGRANSLNLGATLAPQTWLWRKALPRRHAIRRAHDGKPNFMRCDAGVQLSTILTAPQPRSGTRPAAT